MKKIKRFFGFILLIILIIAGINIYLGYNKFKNALLEENLSEKVENIQSGKYYTHFDDIPKMYLDAVVAVEDRRFYYHPGIDPIGISRAVISDFKQKKLAEGGSTITQQTAKNMYFMSEESISRKIAEMFMAVELEKHYSKEEILELYCNVIYFGSGYYNIKDASKGYFGKKPSEMNDYECTLLAGIPNAPSLYSPKVNPELAEKRQEKVVDAMIDCGYIDEDYAEIILEGE